MRQLDFLKQLTSVFRAKPAAPPPAEPQPDIVHGALEGGTPATPPGVAGTPPGSENLEGHARTLLIQIGCEDLAATIRIVWNPRMRSTAGMAFPRRGLITLNPRLREFGDDEVDRTLRHELAHLLAHHRAGRRRIAPHGPEWARACRDLGLVDEKRCHDLPLPRRQMTARHFYRCPSCAFELRRVRPLRRKSACLTCCRRHNGGGYDERFRFQKIPPPA